MKRTLSLSLLTALLCAFAWAQIGTSTITGRATDPTGATVPGVKVTVVQIGTNFTYTATTNTDGIYRVQSLQPGKYRVSFEASGFKRSVRDDVELNIGDTHAIDMTLQIGNVAESVEVVGAVALLETETSATGTVMSGNVLYDMPLYQRYINSTLHLVPGMSAGGYAYGGDLGSYHLAGQRSGAIGIFEDGVNGNDQNSGTGVIKPMQNATAEVKVITTIPSAEYGHSAGGVISVAKKSGTNELHGMGSFYGRSRMMQHRLFFDKFRTSQATFTRPSGVPVFFMMPDANVSGPVYIPKVYDGRNKTFFFFGYQRLHEKKVAQVDSSVPSAGMRAGDFNFPGVTGNPIFDPGSTVFVNGAWQRTPFSGNLIPQSRIDPVARKVLEFDPWQQPNRAGTYTSLGASGNYLADEFAKVFNPDYNLRLDHQFSPSFKIYYSYTMNDFSGFQRPWNIRPERPEFDGAAGNYNPSRNQNMSFGKTWIISSALVNDARVGYYRRWAETQVPSFQQNWAQKLGIPNISGDLMPAFSGGDRNAPNSLYGLIGATPNRNVNETISFRDDLSFIRGTHAFKMGYEVLRFRLNSAVLANPVTYDFSGSTTGLQAGGAAVPNTGNPFAGFLTGYFTTATFRTELSSWLPRSSIHSFYFQDDWKITPHLTANLGIRYSNESPYNTKYGGMSQFDPAGTDSLTGGKGAVLHPSQSLNRRDSNNFNPRIGLAWHPLERWVFRGGVGMYTVDVKFPTGRDQYDEYVATATIQAAAGDPTPGGVLSRMPAAPKPVILASGASPFFTAVNNYSGRNVSLWDPALRNPYVMNWNLSVQHEFRNGYLLETSYQGSSGVGLVERWEINTFPNEFLSNDPVRRDALLAQAQNLRPYPQFGNVTMRSNFGHSSFHSGTVKLEKRMSKGLYFITFYTYSKAIDSSDGDNSGGGVAPITNRNLEKARAGFDRNHRYVGTVNWELPFGKNKRWASSSRFANAVFGGLELSWIQTVESGNPINFGFTNSPSNYWPTFVGARRPNVVSSPVYDFGLWNNGGPDRFTANNRPAVIDMNAFAYPGAYTIGNAGRNILTGPRLVWAQVSAQKNFWITEKVKAQLRWDFQNALKTYNFTGPTNTVDFRNVQTFGKLLDDPRTASFGGQPLMNLTVQIQF